MLKLGVNKVSNSDYHADQTYLSSSNLKLLLKDPAQFYDEKILGNRKSSTGSHFDEGSLTHSLILEPEQVATEYAFYHGMRKQGTDYENFALANRGKTVISRAQKIRVDNYIDAYNKRPAALNLIQGGEPEHTVCQNISDVPVKVRCDYINIEKGYIVDVKTTSFPADVDSFRLTIDQWGYDLSCALYTAVVSQFYGKPFDFYFLVIDKKLLTCEVYKASQKTLNKGLAQVSQALSLYKKCKESGIWLKEQAPTIVSKDYEIQEV